MGPDWWVDAQLAAEEEHDPDAYGGRAWDQLSSDEVAAAVEDVIRGGADQLHQEGRYGT